MEQVVRRCQQGDRASMGQLYTMMHDELLAQCRRYVANDSVAEDLLHDAFLLIFDNIGQLNSPDKARAWMHKVVKNVCLLYVQQRNHRTEVPVDEARGAAQRPEQESTLTYEDILNAIEHLPSGYRQVFRLSVLEGLTHQQIADLLGIEAHTSSSQLMRAKRQLRQLLQVMLFSLLGGVLLGGFYYWTQRGDWHDVAEEDASTSASAKSMAGVADTTVSMPSDEREKAARVKGHRRVDKRVAVEESGWKETSDTASERKAVVHETMTAQDTERKDTAAQQPYVASHPLPERSVGRKSPSSFSLSLAYSGLPNAADKQLPYGAEDMNGDVDSIVHHRMPVTLALNARYFLGSRTWLDGGIRYTSLSSETRVGNTYIHMLEQQRVRFLGLSLGVGNEFWHHRRWSLYGTASLTYELPLHATKETAYWMDGHLIETESKRIEPSTQWSVGVGMGLQFSLTPNIGFFVEPSLQYHFHGADGVETWRTAHPLAPTLPLGVRLSF